MTSRFIALTTLVLALCWSAPSLAQKVSSQAVRAADSAGSVRVLVVLSEPATSLAGPAKAGARKQMVAAAVDDVLASLAPHGHRVYRRFDLVPAVALVVDRAALLTLQRNPAVLRADVDAGGSGHAVAPDEASVLNTVSGLQAAGLSGQGMKIAVIDTGVDTDHADLRDRLVDQQCFCSNSSGTGGCCPNGQATQSGAGSAEDDNGHGTNVTGIIVGEGKVAPRGALPAAQLVAVKVLDSGNRFCCSSDVVAAMDWVAANHPDVDVVNMSLGTSARFAGDCDGATAFTLAMSSAVAGLVARGAVVAVSTGNQGDSAMAEAPACIAQAVGVAATWDFSGGAATFLGCSEASTSPRQPTCFSNRSATTDLYAAGAFVTATGNSGGTSTYGGTSMAAPMVAACAAALKQAAPAATVVQRVDAMKLSPTRVTDPVSGRAYPFLNCTDAVRLLAPSAMPIRVNGAQPLIPPGRAALPKPTQTSPPGIATPAASNPRSRSSATAER